MNFRCRSPLIGSRLLLVYRATPRVFASSERGNAFNSVGRGEGRRRKRLIGLFGECDSFSKRPSYALMSTTVHLYLSLLYLRDDFLFIRVDWIVSIERSRKFVGLYLLFIFGILDWKWKFLKGLLSFEKNWLIKCF